jgi:DNA-binding IscR family transcriptional regulator
VTLRDLYRAVEDESSLFSVTLREVFAEAESALHAKLAGITLEQVVRKLGTSAPARRRA